MYYYYFTKSKGHTGNCFYDCFLFFNKVLGRETDIDILYKNKTTGDSCPLLVEQKIKLLTYD